MLKYDDAGLRNVWLANGYELHDTAYGKAVSYHDIHGLTHAICAALVNKPGPLTGPSSATCACTCACPRCLWARCRA